MDESFATVWEAIAGAIPEAAAVVQRTDDGERRLTWAELEDRAARLASAFAAHGVGEGGHVALFLYNAPEYQERLFACSKIRARTANVNFRYEAAELVALPENADAEILVYHRALASRVAAVRESLPALRLLVEVDDGSELASVPGALVYDEILASYDAMPPVARSGDDAVLWYTGGTTGLPKGVLWRQGTLLEYGSVYAADLIGRPVPQSVADAAACARELRDAGTRPLALLTTPLVHATAAYQTMVWLSVGGALALLPRGRVDGDEVCATIEREQVTLLSIVGDVILRRIVAALERAETRGRPYDLSSPRPVPT